ncbi:MAG: DNRLRE domain-containing protein [Candidatus Brockarchaeota archaeon]|nr:DNRLRE domain-containing protein [Candidatus Brockarchaeota archaeon]
MLNMKRIFLTVLTMTIIFSFAIFEAAQATPTTELTRSFSPIADAYVSAYHPDTNYGGSYLCVRSWRYDSESRVARTYIRFNLTTIPPGSKITSATLNLYMYDAPSDSRTFWCHVVTMSWTEAGITWNSQPSVSPTGFSPVYTGTSDGKWLSWDVKSSVQKIAAKDASSYQANYGWQISDGDEGFPIIEEAKFYSRESSSNKPYLEVKYYPPHLELSVASTTIQAGNWVKMTVYRKTEDNEAITRGNLEVDLSSSSTSANKIFSLTQGGDAVTKLTIPDGSDHKDFYYYDDKAGTWDLRVSTDDYVYWVWSGGFIRPVANYGDDTESLTVTPGPLHHFTFDLIASPKQVATPFSITITAYDAFNNIKTDYTGTNSLVDTTGTINPTVTGAFVNGKWTGTVVINRIGSNVKITTSGADKRGESNSFSVKAGPAAKLSIEPSSFTMASGVTYSYITISLRDANNFETTHTSAVIVALSTTSSEGKFRQLGTTIDITGVVIPAGERSVKVDYYDIVGGTQTLTASATGLTSGTATVAMIPDTIPPVTTMTIGSPKHLSDTTTYVSGSTVFELSASDDASGLRKRSTDLTPTPGTLILRGLLFQHFQRASTS